MAHKRKTVMADINMVPFIDITLILLIIFMVMSPMLVQMQMNVDLPKSNAVNTTAEDDVIRIEVQKNGTIRIDNRSYTLTNLERELVLRMGKANKKTIMVEADKNVPIQTVVDVFDIAKKLGAAKLGIGVLSKN
ncbi:MAG: biopolymer transporter ExbD [Elusimicrobiaceae bacterium]|nr:biopolymer transporter ExbD [Elusimicrobiaceae bacterium]MBR5609647.1 biopolymer transporter ExbD [Elusimicrobiaceae bacterium]